VPQEFLRLAGEHPAHPGSGKGPKPRFRSKPMRTDHTFC
jgi:hypothetical protein